MALGSSSSSSAPEAGRVVDYPPPPWRMAGPAAIVTGVVVMDVVRPRIPESLPIRPVFRDRAGVVFLVADYREGSTLRYGEFAVLLGPVVDRGKVGWWVDTMLVDSEASRVGGREIWAVPKELAQFDWRDDGVSVRGVADFTWSRPRLRPPLPAAGHFLGGFDGPLRRARIAGTFRGAPARVKLDLPVESPVADLEPGWLPRVSVAGEVDVKAHAPR